MNRRLWLLACALVGISACAAEPSVSGGGATGGAGGAGGTAGSAGAAGGDAGTGGWAGSAAGWGGVGGGLGGYGGYGGDAGESGAGAGGDDCIPGMRCGPTNPDDDSCGTLTLNAEVEETVTEEIAPGNLLVVFDRSGSMDSNWNGTPKYRVAGEALMNALEPLQEYLTVGGIFFPSVDQVAAGANCDCSVLSNWIPVVGCCLGGAANSCVVNTIDQRDQISFRSGADFIAEVPNQWRLQGASSTPLQTAVERAEQALANAVYDGPMSVVIVTDGAPNCGTQSQTVTNQVAAWAAQGIKTYVIGLPGAGGAANLLTTLAMTGQTGAFIDPADAADLEMRLREIVSSIVTLTTSVSFNSCAIVLNPPAEAPDDLQLVVVENGMELGVDRNLGAGGGWSVTSDGSNVEIFGELCEEAKRGRFSSLKFKFGCVNLPPLPPPIPPE